MKRRIRKTRIPLGVFVLQLTLLLALSAAISAGYFYFSVRRDVAGIEQFTRKHSVALAGAFADVAELSFRVQKFDSLKKLFLDEMSAGMIDEAFFVLPTGKIVAHSNPQTEKNLEGTIGSDEFSYNPDIILGPLHRKEKDIRFSPYNIIGKKVPFHKIERELIRRYIYSDVMVNGWITTKAVFTVKKKKELPVGTVGFITGKEKIYRRIEEGRKEGLRLAAYLAAASGGISLIIFLIVMLRYRMIAENTEKLAAARERPVEGKIPARETFKTEDVTGADSAPVNVANEDDETGAGKPAVEGPERGTEVMFLGKEVRKPVRDAIPIKKMKA